MHDALLARARQVALLVTDVDGVLTDGRLWYGPEGETLKAMDTRDGHGLVMLRLAGLKFAVLSGRPQGVLQARFRELGFCHVEERCRDKAGALERIAEGQGLALSQVAFIGDDVNDLPALEVAGLSACPADAVPQVRGAVDYVCGKEGGHGAVRELCEWLLESRGLWPYGQAGH